MDVNGVGWIAAIVIGGIAGWLAEKVMKSNMGLLMNIILGIVGAVVLNAILVALHVGVLGTGWIAYLITGFIGACILIFIGRADPQIGRHSTHSPTAHREGLRRLARRPACASSATLGGLTAVTRMII